MPTLDLLWLPGVTLVPSKLTTQTTLAQEDLIAEAFSKEKKRDKYKVHHFDCSAAAKGSKEISVSMLFNSACQWYMYEKRTKILIQLEIKMWRGRRRKKSLYQ